VDYEPSFEDMNWWRTLLELGKRCWTLSNGGTGHSRAGIGQRDEGSRPATAAEVDHLMQKFKVLSQTVGLGYGSAFQFLLT
jgi:hypothetical protein